MKLRTKTLSALETVLQAAESWFHRCKLACYYARTGLVKPTPKPRVVVRWLRLPPAQSQNETDSYQAQFLCDWPTNLDVKRELAAIDLAHAERLDSVGWSPDLKWPEGGRFGDCYRNIVAGDDK